MKEQEKKNLPEELEDGILKITEPVAETAEEVNASLSDVAETVEDMTETAEIVADDAEQVLDGVTETAETVADDAEQALDGVTETAETVADDAEQVLDGMTEMPEPVQEVSAEVTGDSMALYDMDNPELLMEPEKPKKKIPWKKIAIGAGKFIKTIVPLLMLVLSVLLVFYYIWFPSRNEFHSDCTDTLWWAEAAMQGNGIINPDFSYAALMPFGGNLFMQMWIPFFGITMTTHLLGMTTYFVALVVGLLWLGHELRWKFSFSCIAISILLMTISCSAKIREIFWGHIIYYSLGVLLLVWGMAIVLHIFHLRDKEVVRFRSIRLGVWLLILFAMFTFFCTNSTTAIALFALPIVAAIFCERFLDHEKKFRHPKNVLAIIMLVLCGVGTVLGMKWGEWLCGDVVAGYASAYSHFSETGTWWEHIEGMPMALLYLLGLSINSTEYLMSVPGVQTILLLVFTGLIVILPLIGFCCYPKIKDSSLKMLLWAHLVVAAFISVGYICGLLNSANWRLSPIVFSGTLTSLAFIAWMLRQAGGKRIGVLLMLPLLYFAGNSAYAINQMPADEYKESFKYRLASYLQDLNLSYGYATFWNSNQLTVVTDSACKVRTVDVSMDRGVTINPYQSNTHWFEDQPDQDNYFLLLDTGEFDTFSQSSSPLLERTYTQYTFESYYILVFEENIF